MILSIAILCFLIDFLNVLLFVSIPVLFIITLIFFAPNIEFYLILKNKKDINSKNVIRNKLYNDEDFQDILNDDFIQFFKLINKYSYEEQESALQFITVNSYSENLIQYIKLAENEDVELSIDFMKQIHQKTPILPLTKNEEVLVKVMPIFDFYKMNNIEELIDINHDDYKFIKDNKDNYNLNSDELYIKKFNNICNRFYQINNGNTDKINVLLRISKIFKLNELSDQDINQQFKYVKENFQFVSILELNKLEYDVAKMVH